MEKIWKPFKDAPKTNEHIVVTWNHEKYDITQYDAESGGWWVWPGYLIETDVDHNLPTHFMVIPGKDATL